MSRKEKLALTNHWDELLKLRDRQRDQYANGLQVIEREELPEEVSSLGLLRWYLHPTIDDTCLSSLTFFEQTIPPGSRSGRLQFQGGQVLMIIEGEGYTIIDGVRHAWSAGDIVNVPLRSDGLTVQHFNSSKQQQVRFVAAEPNWFNCVGVDRGCGFELLEEAPEYRSGV